MNKNVFVTGSSSGIGKAIAICFAKAGYDVIVHYNGNEQAGLDTLNQVKQYSSNSILVKGNVANNNEVEELFNIIKNHYGHLDALINNSGITKDNLLLRMSEKEFMDVIDVNCKGTFLCSKQATRLMMKKKQGVIINMASVVGISGNAGQTNYATSKAGIIGFTKSLAKELGSRNIRVNAIAPGFIQTKMTENLSDSIKEEMLKQIPLHRFGKVEEVAQCALFLAEAEYISGQVIQVDGGMLM
ncbi:3-oxoacyl-[acyl-carrier-protein] reductase [Floccifex sp.]|uniref:3-oxoacyl-[acyl-carrier-protein] reductase n=1 Tax=Floccifex sp. TaxID=2815810 RepID=UPI003F099F71